MFTTADLPDDMQYQPDQAVAASGLTINCRHRDPHCPRCIRAAAHLLETTP